MRPHPTSGRRATAAAIVVALLAVASTASAGPWRDELIRPGVSIGKVRLGMTVTEVRRALGKPWTVVVEERGFGRRALQLQYASLRISLFGPNGRERVVVIESGQERERTATGVGPGVLEARLVVQRGVRCNPYAITSPLDGYVRIGSSRMCFIDGPGGVRTVFFSRGPQLFLTGPGETVTRAEFERRWKRAAKIEFVAIRAAGYKTRFEEYG